MSPLGRAKAPPRRGFRHAASDGGRGLLRLFLLEPADQVGHVGRLLLEVALVLLQLLEKLLGGREAPAAEAPVPVVVPTHSFSPPFVTIEKRLDSVLCPAQRLDPLVEHAAAGRRQLVRAPCRTGKIGAPLGDDKALVLERTQGTVEVADVDALAADE